MVDPRDKQSIWWSAIALCAREHRLWWRRGRKGPGRIELDGLNLRGAKLVDLPGLRLVRSDLTRATLMGDLGAVELVACTLDNLVVDGDLSEANLVECQGYTASLRGVRMVRARLGACVLGRSDLSLVDLTRAIVRDCDFSGSDLGDATLSGATFRRTSFRAASLVGHQRVGPYGATVRTRFLHCDFRGADWQGRRLRGVVFDRCAFHGSRGVPVVEAGCRIVAPDFSPGYDGSDVGTAERLEWPTRG